MRARSPARAIAVRLADRLPLLVDAYRFLVHPGWELAIWRDDFAARRRLRWLRDVEPPSPGAPRALFVLRREDLFDIKSRLMLGAALQLEGVEPVVLANHHRVPRILRYARAFGVDSLHFRSDFPLSAAETAKITARRAELMAEEPEFSTVLAWTHGGQPLGERVLSTLIRETLDGEPDLGDPAIHQRLGRLVVQALVNYRQAERILDAIEPRWLLADESGYLTNGPLVDVALARGAEVFEVTPFLRDGTLVFKRMSSELGRETAPSVSRSTLELLSETPWTPAQDAELTRELQRRYGGDSAIQRMYQATTRPVEREGICRELELDPTLPIAVVFSHVLWDASFFYGQDLFLTYRRWLEATILAAAANPAVNWLIKTHPSNAFRLRHGDVSGPVAEVEVVRGCLRDLPQHVRLVLPETTVSSLSLFRHADVGITVRSTAGLEMACFGKPVITAGSGHYSGLGFTIDSSSPGEYLECLARVSDHLAPLGEGQVVRARRYAHALFELRPWVARSFAIRHDFPRDGRHPLDRNLVPIARSLAEAADNGDLHRWAAWAVRGRAADYLETPAPVALDPVPG